MLAAMTPRQKGTALAAGVTAVVVLMGGSVSVTRTLGVGWVSAPRVAIVG